MEPVVDVATATRLLGALSNGWQPDGLGPLSGQPALVVDLDTAGNGYPDSLVSPAPLPCVVIGLSTAATPPDAPAGCDLLLSSAPHPPPPWVGVAGLLTDAVDHLLGRIAEYPTASCTLSQLLRAGERLTLEGALVAESLAYSTLQSGPEFARWLGGRTPRAPSSSLDAEQAPVLVARHGAVLHITLNRPQRRNAFNAAMRDALIGALEVALADETITQVELTGAGPAFCSGGDLDEFGSLPDPATAHLIRTTRSTGARLARCADRTTVRVHGACVGAGIELPAFAGRVIAAPDTRVMLPEIALGLVPGAGGTVSISRRIGRQRCAWLALSGEWIDSQVAADWGLVDLVEPPSV
jgi:enoyl-CoA hydratase/carnithine racemase